MNPHEFSASGFLQSKGLDIVEHNYSWPGGEIDLIALDGDELVFVEVKFRKNCEFGSPLERISKRQQHRIQQSSQIYLKKEWHKAEPYIRFDAIGMLPAHNKTNTQALDDYCEIWQDYLIYWIQAAF